MKASDCYKGNSLIFMVSKTHCLDSRWDLIFYILHNGFIQVLHTSQGHWVTASTMGCLQGEVLLYDSMPPAMTEHLK